MSGPGAAPTRVAPTMHLPHLLRNRPQRAFRSRSVGAAQNHAPRGLLENLTTPAQRVNSGHGWSGFPRGVWAKGLSRKP